MNIGILTYHRAYNYGAFLQAYALKIFVENRGHVVSFIDYQSEGHTDEYKWINPESFKKCNFKGKIYLLTMGILGFSRTNLRQRKMMKLQASCLDIHGKPKSAVEELRDTDRYDAIIFGSDQIWRKSKSNPGGKFDSVYFGEGLHPSKKIAYAPSMGVLTLDDSDKKLLRKYLDSFDFLSCRERDLKELLMPLSTKPIQQVVDPVFLLPQQYWVDKISDIKKGESAYVLVYNLMHSEDVRRMALKIANERHLKVIEVTGSVQPTVFKKNVLQTEDAFEFLSLINNASFIVTSSFHAVAFSIIFQKNFYALGFKNNGGRVRSLLELANLPDRLLPDDYNGEIANVDYSDCDMSSPIMSSISFLENSLQ